MWGRACFVWAADVAAGPVSLMFGILMLAGRFCTPRRTKSFSDQCRNRNSRVLISAQSTSSHALRLSVALGDVLQRRPARSSVDGRGTAPRRYSSSRISVVGLLRGEQLADAVVRVAQLVVDRRAVDELQRLGEVAVALALALAGQLAGRLAERLQERVVDLAVGQLDRPRARPAARRTSPAPPSRRRSRRAAARPSAAS